jgi:nucleoside-diphosphate-sugar epimerase
MIDRHSKTNRFLVTGAAGFIGSHLVEALVTLGGDVVGVDCFTDYYSLERKWDNIREAERVGSFELRNANLADAPLEPLLEGIDVIFHLAGQPGVRLSWKEGFREYVERNVVATQRLLEACRFFPQVKVINSSSSSVYGDAAQYPTSESLPARPVSPYGVTKLAAEQLCSAYGTSFGVRAVSLRYFSVYGPRQRPDMATFRMIEAAKHGSTFSVFGDGEQLRDFTFVADVVRANLAAASTELEPGSIYNVGGGSSCSVLDMIDMVSSFTGEKVRVEFHPEIKGDARRTSADISKAEHDLAWHPQTPIELGVKAQVAWQLDMPS